MSLPLRDAKSTIAQSAEGFPLLGHAVYWSINDININYQAFLAILEELGIPVEVANAVQAKSALIKAIRAETKGTKNSFHRNVVDNEVRAGFAIVRTTSVDAENVDVGFHTETKIVLDKETKEVRIDGGNSDEIRAAYEAFRETYTSDRFRNVVLKIIRNHCQGISIRERGGIYFVPSTHNDMFVKLQGLFARFSGCSLDVVPVIDTKEAKKAMWKALTSEVSEEMARFREDVASLPPDASDRTLDVRLERFAKLRDKVENYEFLFTETASDLKAELISLSAQIKKRLE